MEPIRKKHAHPKKTQSKICTKVNDKLLTKVGTTKACPSIPRRKIVFYGECLYCTALLPEKRFYVLNCGHWLHRKCAEKLNKRECPECRSPLKGKHMTEVLKRIKVKERAHERELEAQRRADSLELVRSLSRIGTSFLFPSIEYDESEDETDDDMFFTNLFTLFYHFV
jgi:zinc-binding RING finger protein